MAADLEFRIGAELTEIKGALASLSRDIASVGRSAQQAGGNNAFAGMQKSAGGAIGTIAKLAASILSIHAAMRVIGQADELTTLNARLRIATGSTEEYLRAQSALFDLSQNTRSSLSETVDLYSRIALSVKDAGVGQETLLEVVETINQATQLSGASTQAANAALTQLGQGLASGTLRGEELNSILEQTPALADAIAKGMGITRGELRAYGQEGKITAQQVIGALQAQRGEVAAQFAQLPLTVGQSVTLVKNAALSLLGAFDQTTGATGGLAAGIKSVADFLSSDAVLGALVEFATIWRETFSALADDVREAVRILGSLFGGVAESGATVLSTLSRSFKELPVNIMASIRLLAVSVAATFDKIVAGAVFLKDALVAAFTDKTVAQAQAKLQQRLALVDTAYQQSVDAVLSDRDKSLTEAKAAAKRAEEQRRKGRIPTGARGQGNFATTQSAEQKREAEQLRKAQLDAEEKLLKDSSDRQVAILEAQFEDAKLAAADYYRRRGELELAALDQAIAVEQRRAAAGGVDRVKALAEVELLERQKGDVRLRLQREQERNSRELQRDMDQNRAQELELLGRNGEAERLRLESQYRDMIRRLEAEGNTAGVQLINRLIDTQVARARFQELETEFDRVTERLRARQQSIADQQRTGAISTDTAQQSQKQARADAIAQLEVLNAKLQELARSTNDPQIQQGAERTGAALRDMAIESATGIDAAIINLRASLANMRQSFQQSVANAGVDALTKLFTDLTDNSKSADEALRDFVVGFVASMAQIAARALATMLVLQMLEALFPGAGRTAAASGSLVGGTLHGGGMVGTGHKASYPALLFAGAPRYHGGGMVGLKPDERPAVLQTGEEVLSRSDPRNAANGGGNGTRIVNVVDPSLVEGYLQTSAGEKAVLNIISRNPSGVRNALA